MNILKQKSILKKNPYFFTVFDTWIEYFSFVLTYYGSNRKTIKSIFTISLLPTRKFQETVKTKDFKFIVKLKRIGEIVSVNFITFCVRAFFSSCSVI